MVSWFMSMTIKIFVHYRNYHSLKIILERSLVVNAKEACNTHVGNDVINTKAFNVTLTNKTMFYSSWMVSHNSLTFLL